ncbi:hypothetical protein J6590_082221 [Homalodisca vitripennis]|nr:hypothetical protein J6590_082221 [Homalodisca vitripennis]
MKLGVSDSSDNPIVANVFNEFFIGVHMTNLAFHNVNGDPALPSKTWVRRLSQDNQIKQRRAWLLLGQVTAERSCPCKRPACPAIGGGSEVTFKPLVPSFLHIHLFQRKPMSFVTQVPPNKFLVRDIHTKSESGMPTSEDPSLHPETEKHRIILYPANLHYTTKT